MNYYGDAGKEIISFAHYVINYVSNMVELNSINTLLKEK